MQQSKKEKLLIFSKYLLFFGIFYLLFKTSINGYITPFAFGMLFALIWCNQKILVLTPLYVFAGFLADFSMVALYTNIATAIAILFMYGIHIKLKRPIKPMLFLVYAIISQAAGVYLKVSQNANVYFVFIELVVGLLYMFACMKIFECVIVRGINGRFTSLEIICGACVIVSFSCGLFSMQIEGFSLFKLLVCFLILFAGYSFDVKTTLFLSAVIGLGALFSTSNPEYMAPVILFALAAVGFKTKNRIFPVMALVLTEIVIGFYFELYYSYSIISFIPVLIASLVFLALPTKLYSWSQNYYNSTFGSLTMQNIINRSRDAMQKRLRELSNIFAEMDKVFRSMIKGKMAKEELKTLMLSEIKTNLCIDCPQKNKCFRTYGNETNAILETLTTVAFEKGRITLIDIPAVLTSRCVKINQMVFSINELINQYKNYAGLMNSIDASRVLIAEQLFGVSDIMKKLSIEIGKSVKIDKGQEKKLIEELTYNNIICSDALIYHDNNNIVSATLAVRKEDSLKAKIPQIVSKVCKNKMIVTEEESASRAGWQILNLKTSPKFDVVFGTSACTKTSSAQSGDSYSLIRIENDKILMALCDGMGSGEKAEKASSIAISLVENFYKAGFDEEIILSSVNKFLSIGKEDVFSCLDLAVIDLRQGVADFIKLGATNGFLKHFDTIEVIETGALPLGIISNVEPVVHKKILLSGDMIILCTDGVSDSFKSDDDLQDFINNISSLNPQTVADMITEKAIENANGVAIDDITVIVAKIFNRV